MRKVKILVLVFCVSAVSYADVDISGRDDVKVVKGVIVDVDFHPGIPGSQYRSRVPSRWTIHMRDGRIFTFYGSSDLAFSRNKETKFYLIKTREYESQESFNFAGFTEEELKELLKNKEMGSKVFLAIFAAGTLLIVFSILMLVFNGSLSFRKEKASEWEEKSLDVKGEKTTNW